MVTRREEPFRQALLALRDQLREGRFAPGQRIAAIDVAGALGLSPTPVREALSRLAGEGVLEERRGQGYFARSLSALDVADLWRLSLAHLSIALEAHRLGASAAHVVAGSREDAADSVQEVERLLLEWVHDAGGRALAASYAILIVQLGPARRKEPLLFDDLEREATELRESGPALDAGGRLAVLRRFHSRRIAAADRISSLLHL